MDSFYAPYTDLVWQCLKFSGKELAILNDCVAYKEMKRMRKILWLMILGWLISFSCTSCTPSYDPLSEIRGPTKMLIRLPKPSGGIQQDILIVQYPNAQEQPPEIIYGPSNLSTPGVTRRDYTHVILTEESWRALEVLRREWCQTRPRWTTLPPTDQQYTMAMQCLGAAPYLGIVPENALPPIIQALINERPLGK